ncbi:MAG TPA: rRNA maturation RNase YbeY [Bacteroidales bacterium]|nr:rRNA maturation RNase YbeY [Bacteroidales bacterium]
MKVSFNYLDTDKRPILGAKARKLIQTVLFTEGKKLGEINFIFTSNKAVLEINKNYLKHNYFTDVITFNNSVKYRISGDIYISIDQVVINAAHFKVSIGEELARVMIHGVLHLIGYTDDKRIAREGMRAREDFFISKGVELDLFSGNEFKL